MKALRSLRLGMHVHSATVAFERISPEFLQGKDDYFSSSIGVGQAQDRRVPPKVCLAAGSETYFLPMGAALRQCKFSPVWRGQYGERVPDTEPRVVLYKSKQLVPVSARPRLPFLFRSESAPSSFWSLSIALSVAVSSPE